MGMTSLSISNTETKGSDAIEGKVQSSAGCAVARVGVVTFRLPLRHASESVNSGTLNCIAAG
jgi:hypothetical protein